MSFGATKEFLGVLSSWGPPSPIFHIARPHFSPESFRKTWGKFRACSENSKKSPNFRQNWSKIFLKHFYDNLSLKFFIPIEITRLRMVSHLGKDRNPFTERLFGLQISRILIFRPNFRVFPGSFSNLSGKFLQDFSRNSEELEPQDHVGTKIITRLLVVMFLQHQTCAKHFAKNRLSRWIWTVTVCRTKLSPPRSSENLDFWKILCARLVL